MRSTTTAWGPPVGDPLISRPAAVEEFRAMASPCRIVSDDARLVAAGVAMVRDLERRWSRFSATSEITAVNRSGGGMCIVSALTFELVRRAQLARDHTEGWFNPLVHYHLVALGYGPTASPRPRAVGPACLEPIELLPEVRGVRLPDGAGFDPGGIGKGFAADLVADHLVGLGASAAQIELGGDVRLVGEHWAGASWRVRIQSPFDRAVTVAHADLAHGAVATSGTTGVRWLHDGRDVHHLIDPFTGRSSTSDIVQVTAVVSELWWAEILAKVALLRGSAAAPHLFREHGATGAVVLADGTWRAIGIDADASGLCGPVDDMGGTS
jgi:thiamine biosynthesis lipoprotein